MYRSRWEKIKQRIDNLPLPRPTPEREYFLPPISTPRARLSHRRTRLGIRCVYVRVCEEHLDALAKFGWLNPEQRASRAAIKSALDAFLDDALVLRYQGAIWAKMEREKRAEQRAQNQCRPKPTRKSAPANQQNAAL